MLGPLDWSWNFMCVFYSLFLCVFTVLSEISSIFFSFHFCYHTFFTSIPLVYLSNVPFVYNFLSNSFFSLSFMFWVRGFLECLINFGCLVLGSLKSYWRLWASEWGLFTSSFTVGALAVCIVEALPSVSLGKISSWLGQVQSHNFWSLVWRVKVWMLLFGGPN